MIKLDTTTKSLEIDLDSAVTANQLPFYVAYTTLNQTSAQWVAAPSVNGQTNDTTAVTMLAAPVASKTLKIEFVSVFNADTVNAIVTVQINNNSTLVTLIKTTLRPGETIQYADGEGWSFAGKKYYDIGIQDSIPTSANVQLTRSVIGSVDSAYNAKVTDLSALQVTFPPEGRSAFGNALVSQESPVVQLTFAYELNPYLIDIRDNGGSSSISNSMATLSTGAAANQSSTLQSNRRAHYQGGTAVRGKFTAIFTTGVANSEQLVGLGDRHEGFFFGYNGADFGILRRYGGAPEIRTLTITTASSTAENITITLDGDADATVAVTASANTTTTANEIADHDFSGVGEGWNAVAVGSTVVFTSWSSGTKTGTYSLSGATTAVGTFAQTLAGTDHTDDWDAQANWVGDDIFDGNGPSGHTLDPTAGNVYQVDFQYLGFGIIRFFIEHPDDGNFHLVHFITVANTATRPTLDNPTLPLYLAAINDTNTSDLVVQTASMAVFEDGTRRTNGVNRGTRNTKILATANETPIIAIRVNEVRNSKINRSEVKINLVGCAVEHNKPVRINFYAQPTLTDASFTSLGAYSSIYIDTAATAFSGGVFLFSAPLGRTGNTIIDIKQEIDLGRFAAGDILLATAIPNSGTGAEATVSFNFTELI